MKQSPTSGRGRNKSPEPAISNCGHRLVEAEELPCRRAASPVTSRQLRGKDLSVFRANYLH